MTNLPVHDLTSTRAEHDPVNGMFDWNGENHPDGEFRATTVRNYVITYFQPHKEGVRGCVQVHFGREIRFIWTTRARDHAERFAEIAAKDSTGLAFLAVGPWVEAHKGVE